MYQYLDEKQKKQIFWAMIGVFAVLAIFLAIKAVNAIKEFSYIGRGTYAANVISVNGRGEVLAVPDIATFSFSVVENAKTVKEAQDTASKKTNDIITALKASGIAEKDIKTTGYNSYPQYEYRNSVCPQVYGGVNSTGAASSPIYCPPGKQVLKGYEVRQSVEVKVRKTDQAGDILTKVGGLGASDISGLNFVVDNIEKVQAEARDKAIADAKEKAEKLSKSLGVKMTHIINFYENGNTPIAYGMSAKSSMMGAGDVATPPELPVGENSIVSNVTITYEIK